MVGKEIRPDSQGHHADRQEGVPLLFRHDLRAIRIKSVCRQNNLDKKYLKAKLQACLDDAGMPIINGRVRTVFHVSSDIIES